MIWIEFGEWFAKLWIGPNDEPRRLDTLKYLFYRRDFFDGFSWHWVGGLVFPTFLMSSLVEEALGFRKEKTIDNWKLLIWRAP